MHSILRFGILLTYHEIPTGSQKYPSYVEVGFSYGRIVCTGLRGRCLCIGHLFCVWVAGSSCATWWHYEAISYDTRLTAVMVMLPSGGTGFLIRRSWKSCFQRPCIMMIILLYSRLRRMTTLTYLSTLNMYNENLDPSVEPPLQWEKWGYCRVETLACKLDVVRRICNQQAKHLDSTQRYSQPIFERACGPLALKAKRWWPRTSSQGKENETD